MPTKSNASDQSIKAFKKKKEEGSLSGDRKQVYEIIKESEPLTAKQVAAKMEKPHHTISGRFTELRDQYDLIEEWGTVEGQTLWTTTEDEEEEDEKPPLFIEKQSDQDQEKYLIKNGEVVC